MAFNRIVILGSIPEEVDVFNKTVKNYKWDDKEVTIAVGGVGKAAAADALWPFCFCRFPAKQVNYP